MSASRMLAATPSPPPTLHMPPTPRLGFGDNWEPYSPRKSARLASKSSSSPSAALARTPSPAAATRRAALRSPRQASTMSKRNMNSNSDSYKLQQQHTAAAVGATLSPAPTPRKKRMPDADSIHGTHAFLSPEDAVRARKKAAAAASAAAVGALPTPAKTPSKKMHAASQNASNIAAIARNLFHTDVHTGGAHHGAAVEQQQQGDADHTETDPGEPEGPSVDDVMASPSRGRRAKPARRPRKYTGLTLESFTAVEVEEPIAIFTDSQDRVPEVDSSHENPFYGGSGGEAAPDAVTAAAAAANVTPERTAPAARRRSKRSNNLVSIPGEGQQTVADASRREDGLVYVFRGKKIFRKFDDSAFAQEEDVLDGMTPGKRMTRSAIKPRLLFPQEALRGQGSQDGGAGGTTTDDEEALTDIEDHNMHSEEEEEEEKEKEEKEEEEEQKEEKQEEEDAAATAPATPPRAPQFSTPSSPPATVGRALRAAAADAATGATGQPSSSGGGRTKRRSPFDGWRQTKRGAAATAGAGAGHKRQRPAEEEAGVALSSTGAAAAVAASSKRSRT